MSMSGACTRQTTDNCTSYTDDPSSAKHFHNSGSYSSHQPNPYEILLRSAPLYSSMSYKASYPQLLQPYPRRLCCRLLQKTDWFTQEKAARLLTAVLETRPNKSIVANGHAPSTSTASADPIDGPGCRSGGAAHHGWLHRVALHPAAVRADVLLLVMGRGIRAWAAMACGMCWKVRTLHHQRWMLRPMCQIIHVECRRPSHPSRSVPVAVSSLSKLLRERPARALAQRNGILQLLSAILRSGLPCRLQGLGLDGREMQGAASGRSNKVPPF